MLLCWGAVIVYCVLHQDWVKLFQDQKQSRQPPHGALRIVSDEVPKTREQVVAHTSLFVYNSRSGHEGGSTSISNCYYAQCDWCDMYVQCKGVCVCARWCGKCGKVMDMDTGSCASIVVVRVLIMRECAVVIMLHRGWSVRITH